MDADKVVSIYACYSTLLHACCAVVFKRHVYWLWLQADTLDEAIALVNANPWGNGTAIFTDSGSAARKFQHDVQVRQECCKTSAVIKGFFFARLAWHSHFHRHRLSSTQVPAPRAGEATVLHKDCGA